MKVGPVVLVFVAVVLLSILSNDVNAAKPASKALKKFAVKTDKKGHKKSPKTKFDNVNGLGMAFTFVDDAGNDKDSDDQPTLSLRKCHEVHPNGSNVAGGCAFDFTTGTPTESAAVPEKLKGRGNMKVNATKISLRRGFGCGNAEIQVYNIEEDATLDNDGEEETLTAGSMKMTVVLSNVTRNGTAIEGLKCKFVTKARKGKQLGKKKARNANRPHTVDLGGNGTCSFSSKVKVDNVTQTMANSSVVINSDGTVDVQLPPGLNMEYDPSLDPGDEELGDDTGNSASSMTDGILLIAGTFALITLK